MAQQKFQMEDIMAEWLKRGATADRRRRMP
jgi:hypothetical protein